MKIMILKRRTTQLLFFLLGLFLLFSCLDKPDVNSSSKYDASKPVLVETFYPDSGGLATKMIIKGSNFGVEKEKIKVYFNEKRAAVIKAVGDRIYVIVPRSPGDTCHLSVVVESDSVNIVDKTFIYKTGVVVTTISGIQDAIGDQIDGTLAEATFGWPAYLTLDADKNIYVSEGKWTKVFSPAKPIIIRQINEKEDFVLTLAKGGLLNNPCAPTTDFEKKNIYIPDDDGGAMYILDPDKEWTLRKVNLIEDGKSIMNKNWKHSFAINPTDSKIYSRMANGQIFRFDPNTRKVEVLKTDTPPCDSFLAFNPKQPNLLYVCMSGIHAIYTFNVDTEEWKIFAGSNLGGAAAGFEDGPLLDSKFNTPRQIVFDSNGNMYVADSKNHVIRHISDKGLVTTLVGIAGKKGYMDGDPELALFDTPWGVAIDEDNQVYVADTRNRVIRKLSIE